MACAITYIITIAEFPYLDYTVPQCNINFTLYCSLIGGFQFLEVSLLLAYIKS